jgi:hypothetical protein
MPCYTKFRENYFSLSKVGGGTPRHTDTTTNTHGMEIVKTSLVFFKIMKVQQK